MKFTTSTSANTFSFTPCHRTKEMSSRLATYTNFSSTERQDLTPQHSNILHHCHTLTCNNRWKGVYFTIIIVTLTTASVVLSCSAFSSTAPITRIYPPLQAPSSPRLPTRKMGDMPFSIHYAPLEMISSTSTTSSSGTDSDNSDNIRDLLPSQVPDTKRHEIKVTNWLPWLPTKIQIQQLKVVELREACAERGLPKYGRKSELQARLLEWISNHHQRRVENRRLNNLDYYKTIQEGKKTKRKIAKSLDDILDHRVLPLQGKESIKDSSNNDFPNTFTPSEDADDDIDEGYCRNDKSSCKPPTTTPTKEYLNFLTRTFHTNTTYSNLQVKQLYASAKRADQSGDRAGSKRILRQLLEATPHDGRVIRRLARIATEEGDINEARRLLQSGCRVNPQNAHLWHGLAQLELDSGHFDRARIYFREAISADPFLPNPHHAWGRLEHSQGNIRMAMSLFKKGIRYSPRNHRLYHALGGLYREAGMLRKAEEAFRKGMECGPNWSQPFFCTSLAYAMYEKEGTEPARRWLKKGVGMNRKHAQGWLALAQLEESEGRTEEARDVYKQAVEVYEKGRGIVTGKEWLKQKKSKAEETTRNDVIGKQNIVKMKNHFVPKRSGDMWIAVYKNWARMEESQGKLELAQEVYHRATQVFPSDWGILLRWANLLSNNRIQHSRTKTMFERACKKAGTSNAEPYRLYAEHEISLSNHLRARALLYHGALSTTSSPDGQERGLALLYHTWALLEFQHFDNPSRAEVLFDHALRLTKTGDENRAKILFSLAKFEFSHGNYRVAQHCICLSINDEYGRDVVENWLLWADIAEKIGNDHLAKQCREVAKKKKVTKMHSLVKGPGLKKMLCKAPWHRKLFKQDFEEDVNIVLKES